MDAAPNLPRLSVVCFTNDPPHRVAASLAILRPIAHEIVVAVDDRVDPITVAPLVAVADRVVLAEFVPPLEANLAWLHTLATGDWVLRVDGDDVASEALVRRLSTPGWDDGITHAYVSYRWLWGASEGMLAQPPWWPDPALRLIRNVPGIVRFPTGAHRPPEVVGDRRFLDEPLYHLDLVLADEAEREAKADRYERDATGLRTDPGWSVNTTYYLPERLDPAVVTEAVPEADRAAIDAVLGAVAPTIRSSEPPELVHVSAAARRRPGPEPGDAALRVIARPPLAGVRGRTYTATIGVTNLGSVTWRPEDDPPTQVGGVVRDRHGAVVGGELRADLPGPVRPGDEVLVRLAVPQLPEPGPATLDVGLVEEGNGWHDARLEIPMEVRWGRRLLVHAGISPTPHLGDDLILRATLAALARHLPDVVPVLLAHPLADQGERFGVEAVAAPSAARPERLVPGEHPERWSADLVRSAELLAAGEEPLEEAHGRLLAPFVAASALLVVPGGGLASEYGEAAVAAVSLEARIAEALGLPIAVEGAYVGELRTRADRKGVARLAVSARSFTVRDAASAAAVVDLGRGDGPVPVVADPATAMIDLARRTAAGDAAAALAAIGVPPGRPYAVFSLRGGRDGAAQLAVVRAVAEHLPEGTATVYLPHCTGADDDDRLVLEGDGWAARHLGLVPGGIDDHTATAIITGASFAAGSRFHLTLLARWAGIPAIGLVRDEYDTRRLAALDGDPGVRFVPDDDPSWVPEAVAAVLAAPHDPPGLPSEPRDLAARLSGLLPVAPRLA